MLNIRWIVQHPNAGRNIQQFIKKAYVKAWWISVSPQRSSYHEASDEIFSLFVNLKSNLALLYNKGHNLLTPAFPQKILN